MKKELKKILIACDSPRSLLDFRGKLMEELLLTHEVSVFTPKIEQQVIRERLVSMNVRIYESNLNTSNVSIFADLKYVYHLYQIIRKTQPDVFFPYAFKPVIYGSMIANLLKVGCITPMLTGLGYNYLESESNRTLVQNLTRLLLKISLRANDRMRIILQNKDDYTTLIRANTITKKNKTYIVNGSGVDLSHYNYSPPDYKNITFLMIARLINAKGINEYYKAAKFIKSTYPHVKFDLIGPYDDNIDAISKELFVKISSDGTLNYLGLIPDVRQHITRSSVVVLPSYYGEGVPRSILEAMAMGRAIITSDSVGCKETINPHQDGVNGFLIPIKNVDELAAKMEYYILHPEDIIKFGLNGRKYAKEKFDVNKVNKQMLQIIISSN
ncbi:glycosyltransferase family 4 protein [Pedobacter sp.]|uniref:glycosyltransferase family 4 protein n=1 Tax=Pedobacter sp. TaxID=1411316 RepID=UPI003D7FD69B